MGNLDHIMSFTRAMVTLCTVYSNTKLFVSETEFIIMRCRNYEVKSHKNGSLSRKTSGCTSRMLSALLQMILARLVLRISCNCSENQKACNGIRKSQLIVTNGSKTAMMDVIVSSICFIR